MDIKDIINLGVPAIAGALMGWGAMKVKVNNLEKAIDSMAAGCSNYRNACQGDISKKLDNITKDTKEFFTIAIRDRLEVLKEINALSQSFARLDQKVEDLLNGKHH